MISDEIRKQENKDQIESLTYWAERLDDMGQSIGAFCLRDAARWINYLEYLATAEEPKKRDE